MDQQQKNRLLKRKLSWKNKMDKKIVYNVFSSYAIICGSFIRKHFENLYGIP